jgi:hypothetical protein
MTKLVDQRGYAGLAACSGGTGAGVIVLRAAIG